jgi:predicted permease
MVEDLVAALRRLKRNRASALAVILLLGMAIAINGCVFAVAYGLLWKPLPYPAQARLVQLALHSVRLNTDLGWSPPYLHAVAADTHSLDVVAGYRRREVVLSDAQGKPGATTTAVAAEPGLLGLVGAHAAAGRLLLADDARAGAEPVVLIDSSLWRRRFGGSPSAIGAKLRVGSEDRRIVGVVAEGAAFPEKGVELWLPMGFEPADFALENAGSFGDLRAVGRLAPGTGVDAASGEMMRLLRGDAGLKALADEIDLQAAARPLRQVWIEGRESSLRSILLAATLLFIVTTANACNLFMLRMLRRRQEFALLEAVGATRTRRAAFVLSEAALLAAAAALVGAATLPLGLAALRHFDVLPAQSPQAIGLDPATLAALAAMWLVATLALAASGMAFFRQNVHEALRQSGNGQTSSRATHRARQVLVVVQVAATFVLLFGTALLLRSSHRLLAQDIGFERAGQLVGSIQPAAGGEDAVVLRAAIGAWIDAVDALPGVDAVALSTSAPFSQMVLVESFRPPSGADAGRENLPNTYVSYVSAQYPAAVGLPLRRGRAFTRAQAEAGAPVALIDEDLARRYFGDADPVGKVVAVNDSGVGDLVEVTITGVVGAARLHGLSSRDEFPTLYRPEAVPYNVHGMPTDSVEFVVRAADPEAAETRIRALLASMAPQLRFGKLVTMERRVADTIIDQLRLNQLLQILGATTIVLAIVGLYALLAHAVASRQREFGIRQALGADAASLARGVFAQSARLVAVALALGLAPALLLGLALKPRLFEVASFDPVSLVGVALLLLAAQAIASAAPAWRAARTVASEALRSE